MESRTAHRDLYLQGTAMGRGLCLQQEGGWYLRALSQHLEDVRKGSFWGKGSSAELFHPPGCRMPALE